MRFGRLAGVILVLVAGAAVVHAAPAAQDELPATLDRVTGNPYVAYAFFGVLAFFAVILVYRGIRAR